MRAGSLIGFTEAELALILLVVFVIVLPMNKNESSADEKGHVSTVSDSLRFTRDSLATQRKELAAARDSLLLKARGELRSTADPSCSELHNSTERSQPFGPIRVLASAYEFEGRFLDIEELAGAIKAYTERSAQMRCRYTIRISYAADLPAGRINAFRNRFLPRYFIRESIDD